VRLTFRPVQDSSGQQCNALGDPVTDRSRFSRQYLLWFQKLANAVDMGLISETDMTARISKFGVNGFGVGSGKPRRRTVPERQLMFGGGPGAAVKRELEWAAASAAAWPAANPAVKREPVSPKVSPADQFEGHFETPRKISKIADNGSASQAEHSPVQSSAIVEVRRVGSNERTLVLSKHSTGKKGGRPKTGPRRGTAAGAKSNRRQLGEASLRRDVTLQFKVAIINKIVAAGKKPSEIELSIRQEISKQSGFSWRIIGQWYAAKDSIFQQIAKSKLGMYGPRPFGSNERLTGKSKPQCRIRGDTLNNESYQKEVIKSLKDFLDLERSRGHTVSVFMLKDHYLKLLTRFAVKYKLMSTKEQCPDKSASLAQYSKLCLERHDKNADGIKSATRRKLSYSALSRTVLYCKLLYGGVGLITRFPVG